MSYDPMRARANAAKALASVRRGTRKPRTLTELRAHPEVEDVWDEGLCGWWLEARPGFTSPGSGCHVFHEDTVRDLCREFNGREPCACEECGGATDE